MVKSIEFMGVACYHDRVSGRERGDNTIFCFSVDDIRVCHCGDLGHPLDGSTLHSIGHVDVLLIPTRGPAANSGENGPRSRSKVTTCTGKLGQQVGAKRRGASHHFSLFPQSVQ